jgi:hypothetical protein
MWSHRSQSLLWYKSWFLLHLVFVRKTLSYAVPTISSFGSYIHKPHLHCCSASITVHKHTSVYPKVSGLAAWSDNCKRYSSLPLLYRYSMSQSSEFSRHNPLCCFPASNATRKQTHISLSTQSGNFWIRPLVCWYICSWSKQERLRKTTDRIAGIWPGIEQISSGSESDA